MQKGKPRSFFEHIAQYLNWIGYLSFTAIVVIASVDVLGRYLLNMPLMGGLELLELSMAVLGGYTMVYTATCRMHISVDLMYMRFPKFVRKVLHCIGSLMGTTIWGIMAFKAFMMGKQSLVTGFSSSILSIPIGPFEITLALSLGLLSLVSLIQACEVFAGKSVQGQNMGSSL
jgi:TRAP-type C4-dicarboxylate transport system permease small subunit